MEEAFKKPSTRGGVGVIILLDIIIALLIIIAAAYAFFEHTNSQSPTVKDAIKVFTANVSQQTQSEDVAVVTSALQIVNMHFDQSLVPNDLYVLDNVINWNLKKEYRIYQFESSDQSLYSVEFTSDIGGGNSTETFNTYPSGTTSGLTGQIMPKWSISSGQAVAAFTSAAKSYLAMPVQSPIINEELFYPRGMNVPSWNVALILSGADAANAPTLYDTFDANSGKVTTSTYTPNAKFLPLSPQSPTVVFQTSLPPVGSIKISYPRNGQTLKIGSTYSVAWRASGFDNVVGDLAPFSGPGFPAGVFNVAATVGQYTWNTSGFPPGKYIFSLEGTNNKNENLNFASDSVMIILSP